MTKPTAAANADGLPADRSILEAYRQWLHHEGRLLGEELYPDLGDYADRFIPETFASRFHFPDGSDWRDVPKPSTRAAAVLTAVGVIPASASANDAEWSGLRLPAFPIGDDFQPAWSLYQALRTMNQVAMGVLSQPRFESDGDLNAAGRCLEALQIAIACAAEQIAEATRSAPRPDGDGYYRSLIILEDAAVSLEGLDEIAELAREIRDH